MQVVRLTSATINQDTLYAEYKVGTLYPIFRALIMVDIMATSYKDTPHMTQIPIIDFSTWTTGDQPLPLRLKVGKDLVEACHNTGFVYIKNHGLSESLLTEAFTWSKKFFSLSEQEKALAAHPPGSEIFRGYSRIGHETVPPHEEDKIEGVIDYNVRTTLRNRIFC